MDKEDIISEIRRTAKDNDGVALGWRRFETETGIRYYDWFGKFWTRWNDAVREAGVEPNRMSEAYDEITLIKHLVLLTRSLGRVPVHGDLMIAKNNSSTFPSHTAFRRLGSKQQRVSRVIAYCDLNPGNDDVASLWRQLAGAAPTEVEKANESFGFVYLLKHGSRREYKIGRTNNSLRREGEVRIQIPEKLTVLADLQRRNSTNWRK